MYKSYDSSSNQIEVNLGQPTVGLQMVGIWCPLELLGINTTWHYSQDTHLSKMVPHSYYFTRSRKIARLQGGLLFTWAQICARARNPLKGRRSPSLFEDITSIKNSFGEGWKLLASPLIEEGGDVGWIEVLGFWHVLVRGGTVRM